VQLAQHRPAQFAQTEHADPPLRGRQHRPWLPAVFALLAQVLREFAVQGQNRGADVFEHACADARLDHAHHAYLRWQRG
jgi:hypothetical protein